MGPLEGLLIDKLGARRMVIIGTTILGLGFLMFGQIQELWQFYVAFLVMSLGGGLGTWLPMMTVLNSWWVRRRATSMSWVLVGYRLGVVALVPLLTWAIDDSQFGWKAGATGIGVVILLAAIPISRAVRNRPEDYGELPDGVTQAPVTADAAAAGGAEVPSASVDERSFTWQEAIRTKPFWLMSIGHACCTTVIVTIMVHLGPMLVDRGFSLQTVGFVISMYTAIGIGSTLVGGHIGDRIPIPASDIRILYPPVFGSDRAPECLYPANRLLVRHTDGAGRRQGVTDHGHTGRLLWEKVLRQHNGNVDGSHECPAADRAAICWLHVRPDGQLPNSLRLGGIGELDRRRRCSCSWGTRLNKAPGWRLVPPRRIKSRPPSRSQARWTTPAIRRTIRPTWPSRESLSSRAW